jgi:type 1 glutamine amidotransferase
MGGIFDGHPWGSGSVVTLYNEEPEHPCSHQVPHGYQIKDEIYQYKHDEHFTRDKLRILLSLDLKGPNMKKGGMKRKDKDYAVSWVRKSGPTRVFYTNLGHNESTFVDKVALQHMLSGIQYALGDIEADATPSAKLGKLPPNQ